MEGLGCSCGSRAAGLLSAVIGAPVGGLGGWAVEAGELDAELLGVGVVEVVEDGEGQLPGVAGSVVVACGVVGVADVGEGAGFFVPVAEVTVQGEGVVVAGDGVGVVAELVVGIAEAVPGSGLAVTVAESLEQGEGLLAGG